MIGYSKSRIAELMKEKGFGIQAPLNNGLDYVRVEMDEFVPADLDKLTKKMSYTKLLNNTQPINLDLSEMTTYRDSVKGLFTDTVKGSSICMRLFRVHRGGLDDSLNTAIYCKDGLKSIKEYAIDESFFLPPKTTSLTELLHIDNKPIIDNRLPDWWGAIEFEVYMSHPLYGKVIVGYCNFREN